MNDATNDATNQVSEFFESSAAPNPLWQYVQALSPETAARLSQPESPEVLQVMERNIVSMLGGLPLDQFDVTITTSRQQLGRLIASAMMSGYFLRNAEQRMNIENAFEAIAAGESEE
jgi:hypothetical protein